MGVEDYEACCTDAVSVLAIMRQLEARMFQALERQGIVLQQHTHTTTATDAATDGTAANGDQLPVLDVPLQLVVPMVDTNGVEVVVQPQQEPVKLEVLPADAVLAVAPAATELTPAPELRPAVDVQMSF